MAQPHRGVELLGLKPLVLGQTVCSQASSGQWWPAEVFHDNSDFTYFLIVKDDVQTQWPRVHWADIIDMSCVDFYQGELDREFGRADQLQEQQQQQESEQQPEQQQPEQQQQQQQLQQQQWAEQQQRWAAQQQQWQEQDVQHGQEPQQEEGQKPQRFPIAKKKQAAPWKVVSAAAVAGSVPLLYHLSGAAGPAA